MQIAPADGLQLPDSDRTLCSSQGDFDSLVAGPRLLDLACGDALVRRWLGRCALLSGNSPH